MLWSVSVEIQDESGEMYSSEFYAGSALVYYGAWTKTFTLHMEI